ncbi:hypothetical protein L2744_06655 [Shewanella profunda]|uniref:hypothetical protein n=1 Tax=Shewanella profunda TaxID=254793 RepID=UPI00200FF662|nr:hypothetical protein [Shewanella profunda]MCL1089296.1 hypothetical protein [Shewanella profunda]
MWWRTIWIIAAYWLLSAHFLRYDQLYLAGVFALAPLGILIKHSLIMRLLQAVLFVSVFAVWGVTVIDAIQIRIAHGTPWIRLAVIMGAVMLFTLGAIFCFNGILRLRRQKSYWGTSSIH